MKMLCGDTACGLLFIVVFVASRIVEVCPLVLHHRQGSSGVSEGRVAAVAGVGTHTQQSCRSLINEETHFTLEVSVGTPPQKFELVADTGSDAVIVQSCMCREFTDECKASEDCFTGTNASSTFVGPPPNSTLKVLTFGSGDIVVAATTDVVRLGQYEATMNRSLMLMVHRELEMEQHFEGILGLGVPSPVEAADAPPGAGPPNGGGPRKLKDNTTGNISEPVPRFYEEVGLDRFSMCFNDNMQAGVMRLEPPKAPQMLKQVGYHHWALEFQGFSVGSSGAPKVGFCKETSAEVGQDLACVAIPDSGTTFMMGPQEQVDKLFAELCMHWPRCDPEVNHPHPEKAFVQLISECGDWMTERGLEEVPSIHMHLAAADGETQVLELTSWAYITQRTGYDGADTCYPQFGAIEIYTMHHGSVWIFGGPLFYEYQVVFDSQPPSIGFEKGSCGSCGSEALNSSSISFSRAHRLPRSMNRPPRMPTMKLDQPV